jgi:amino acid transporter
MAQLMLPEFASERLVRGPTPRRGPIFGAILSVAVVLRALVPLAGLEGEERWWSMAAAGAIAWLAVAAFAVLVWRARRTHRAHVARISAARASELPMRS